MKLLRLHIEVDMAILGAIVEVAAVAMEVMEGTVVMVVVVEAEADVAAVVVEEVEDMVVFHKVEVFCFVNE